MKIKERKKSRENIKYDKKNNSINSIYTIHINIIESIKQDF